MHSEEWGVSFDVSVAKKMAWSTAMRGVEVEIQSRRQSGERISDARRVSLHCWNLRVCVFQAFRSSDLIVNLALLNADIQVPAVPNKTLEPTSMAVTIRAAARLAPAMLVTHL